MRQEIGSTTITTYAEVHEDEDGEVTLDSDAGIHLEILTDYPFDSAGSLRAARNAVRAAHEKLSNS